MASALATEHKIMSTTQAHLILPIFSFIGLGIFMGGVVFLILLAPFETAVENDIYRLEWVWRLLLGLGIIPAAFTLYGWLRMQETKVAEKSEVI